MFDQALSSAQAVKKTVWQGDVALHISVSPLLLQSGEGGTFCPQNSEYVNTAQLVCQIAREHGRHVALVPGCSWALSLLRHMTPAVDKAFGSLCYDFALSQYPQDYCLWDFAASVRESEH